MCVYTCVDACLVVMVVVLCCVVLITVVGSTYQNDARTVTGSCCHVRCIFVEL